MLQCFLFAYIAYYGSNIVFSERLDWSYVNAQDETLDSNSFSGCLNPAAWCGTQVYDHVAFFYETVFFYGLKQFIC